MKETNIDSMKYRKSTHLAGVDVEMIISEKGKCVLTIKECYFQKGVNVSGNKTDGYFIEFKENVKPLVVNSTNRKNIGDIVKINKKLSNVDSRNIGNWENVLIELVFDPTVKMMGKVVGGIKVLPISPIPNISDKEAIDTLSLCNNLESLKTTWSNLIKDDEKKLPTVIAFKEKLKKELK